MNENWKETAKSAWAACDSRSLTRDEKIALVAEAIVLQYTERDGYRCGDFEWLAQRSPLTVRQFSAICRHHLSKVSALLDGLQLRYNKSDYTPSGRGAFGRLGGGRRGYSSKASLSIG